MYDLIVIGGGPAGLTATVYALRKRLNVLLISKDLGGKTNYRHVVSNARDVMAIMKGHDFPLALGGHVHMREELRYAATPTRFVQAAAVVGPNPTGGFSHPSGVTVYRVTRGRISEGSFVPLGIPGAGGRRRGAAGKDRLT